MIDILLAAIIIVIGSMILRIVNDHRNKNK